MIVANCFNIVSKLMCQNSIVLYHIQLKDGSNLLVPASTFDALITKYNIDLENKSEIPRVNVSANATGIYTLKEDTNDASKLAFYKNATLVPSNVKAIQELDRQLSLVMRKENSIEVLKKWLEKEDFIKCDFNDFNGHNRTTFAYINITQGEKLGMSSSGFFLRPKYYILAKDLENFGIDLVEFDKSITGSIVRDVLPGSASCTGNFYIKSNRIVAEDEGWYIQEELALGVYGDRKVGEGWYRLGLCFRRTLGEYFSVLPPKIEKVLGFDQPRLSYSQVGSIPITDKQSTAEALAYMYYKRNEQIEDMAGRETTCGYDTAKLATSRGYNKLRLVHLEVSPKVKSYLDANFNVKNSVNITSDKSETFKVEESNKGGFFGKLKNMLN